jgi:orotate phosphoribosyltransferase
MVCDIKKLLALLKECGAFMEGHFDLGDDCHSNIYCDIAKIFSDRAVKKYICGNLAHLFRGEKIDIVLGVTPIGNILAEEVYHQLKLGHNQTNVQLLLGEFSSEGDLFLYGDLPINKRILIVEGLVDLDSPACGAAEQLKNMDVELVALGAAIAMEGTTVASTGGPDKLAWLIHRDQFEWESPSCPLCRDRKGQPAIPMPGS